MVFDIFSHRMPEALLKWQFYLFLSPPTLLVLWMASRILRWAEFEGHPRGVRFIHHGLFGMRRREWTETELEDIRCEDSCSKVNGHPQYRLVFELSSGKKTRLLHGTSSEILEAVASQLRKVLWSPPPKDPASS